MFYLVYKTTFLPTGQFYIGRHYTKNINDDYLGSGIKILAMVKKYGKSNFTKEILHYCASAEKMVEKEIEEIRKVFYEDKCLNLMIGDPRFTGAIVVSEESKRKMSESKKKTHNTPEVKAKLSHNAKNRSEETRYKLGGANRGKKISQDIRDKLSATISGAGNPRAKEWEILFEDGRKSIKVKGLKEWCRDQGVKYISLYVKAKRGDVSFLNGIRVVEC